MNRFSEKKYKEFEKGFLGEKNYEIQIHNLKSPTLKLQLDMHHLSLNKQANYLGQRNQKLKDDKTDRKVKAHIAPYSQQNYEFGYQQPFNFNPKWKCSVYAGIANIGQNEIVKQHHKDYIIRGHMKSNNLHNSLQLKYDETGNYGVEWSLRFFNFTKKDMDINTTISQNKIQQETPSIDNLQEQNVQLNLNQEVQDKINKDNKEQQIVNSQNNNNQFKYELCLLFKTIKFNQLQTSLFADLMFKKYEGILSANLSGKSLKGIMCMFKYNSSLQLKLSSDSLSQESTVITSDANKHRGGVELVYQYQFNKYIHLKNYINSNYTIATQLSYHPHDFVTLIYSATVNIQKFKQENEDYKVGYGIHFNF